MTFSWISIDLLASSLASSRGFLILSLAFLEMESAFCWTTYELRMVSGVPNSFSYRLLQNSKTSAAWSILRLKVKHSASRIRVCATLKRGWERGVYRNSGLERID